MLKILSFGFGPTSLVGLKSSIVSRLLCNLGHPDFVGHSRSLETKWFDLQKYEFLLNDNST